MSSFSSPTVQLIENRPATTSLLIAECFEKQHAHVMRDIQNLVSDCPENFSRSNFGLANYEDNQSKLRPMYNVFFDGFILLVMGYTCKKALKMKLAYIEAFNAMKAKLEEQRLSDSAATLTPAQQRILQNIVEAKARLVSGIDKPVPGSFTRKSGSALKTIFSLRNTPSLSRANFPKP